MQHHVGGGDTLQATDRQHPVDGPLHQPHIGEEDAAVSGGQLRAKLRDIVRGRQQVRHNSHCHIFEKEQNEFAKKYATETGDFFMKINTKATEYKKEYLGWFICHCMNPPNHYRPCFG